jgi:hypothetical protein
MLYVIKVMNDLLKLSAKKRKQAKQVLLDGNVISTLLKYGEPEIIGSFAFDVMYDSDIDIVVLTKNPRKSSFDALNDFINQRKFQKYEYGDFLKFKRTNRPNGFIVNLRSNIAGVKWEIEIWFLKSIKKEKQLTKLLKKEINSDAKKIKILILKHKRAIDKISKHNLSSLDIYKKVI